MCQVASEAPSHDNVEEIGKFMQYLAPQLEELWIQFLHRLDYDDTGRPILPG